LPYVILTIVIDITGIRLSLFVADSRSLSVAVLSRSYAIYSDLLIIVIIVSIIIIIIIIVIYNPLGNLNSGRSGP